MKESRVCAVVVTFNRKDMLVECLESLRNQSKPLNGIYVIDNASTDGTSQLLQEKEYIGELPPVDHDRDWSKCYNIKNLIDGNQIKLHYVRLYENTGGAGGFHEGIKRAYEEGYDWIWIMDDDVEPDNECLHNLLGYKSISKVLVPLRLSKDGEIDEYATMKYDLSNPFLIDPRKTSVINTFKNVDEIPLVIELEDFSFEGPLIHKSIIKKVGYPNKDFFYYGDDTVYSLDISQNLKEKILLIRDAIVIRKLGRDNTKMANWKTYYYVRNMNYIYFRYGKNPFIRLRPYIYIIPMILYLLIGNKTKSTVFYHALTDFKREKLPLRYKP